MKKIAMFIAVVAAVAGLSYGASVTTNSAGQIVESFTNAYGQAFTVVIGQVGSGTVTAVPAPAQIVVHQGTTWTPTAYVPVQIGQVAIWSTSNKVYVATGTTTGDWTLVTN